MKYTNLSEAEFKSMTDGDPDQLDHLYKMTQQKLKDEANITYLQSLTLVLS
ncbi:hypothetical protein [Lactiplantibacillus mudanjiangensis]|uniref:hypothetical protein n=1 Tax=Lactiplantibacillus mudanjiangensis TaxID=1296538 RepID=UPI0013EF3065|nr:hypothetical protein [Lactiplantibacillus mudanjiangensis]